VKAEFQTKCPCITRNAMEIFLAELEVVVIYDFVAEVGYGCMSGKWSTSEVTGNRCGVPLAIIV